MKRAASRLSSSYSSSKSRAPSDSNPSKKSSSSSQMEIESPAVLPSPQEGSDGTSGANTDDTIALNGLTEEEYLAALKKNERADIWAHFTRRFKEGKIRAYCHYCKNKSFASHPKINGTTALLHHMEKCREYPPNKEMWSKRQKVLTHDKSNDLVAIGCTQDEITKACVKMVVLDELPFSFVEGEGFRHFCVVGLPHWRVPSRKTIAKDVLNLFYSEKTKLKNDLSAYRVCLTTDTWTSIQNINYMVLTAHFIDANWMLHKRILNFCVIPNHKGESIARLLEECLVEWGIERVLTITVDNASSNDAGLKDLIKRISNWRVSNALLHDGKNLHMRCVAHILNLIVNDGLGLLNKCIQSIRNAVRYARSSPQRLDMFKKCVEKVKIESKGLVIMDVPTRWNSTFLMLQAALKFRQAFDRLVEDDGHYLGYFVGDNNEKSREGPPSDDDWDKAGVFANFLRPFYEVTLKVCCSNTPTIHTIFGDLVKIQSLLKETGNTLLSSISLPMQDKYDKYWGNIDKVNDYFFIAMVLDPRHKFDKLGDYLELIYGEFDERVENTKGVVQGLLYDMYKIYFEDSSLASQQSQQSEGSGGSSSASNSSEVNSSSNMTEMERKLAEKEQRRKAKKAGIINNDVDRYLQDAIEGDDDSNFDILNWWRVNGISKYPILARIARDILAIPVSTIASESSFSTSGRVIDPFRSSLSPKMVEALICTQNWLRSTHVALHHEPTIEEMEFCEEIEKEYTSRASTKGDMLPPKPMTHNGA